MLERDKEPNTNSIERVRAQLSSGPNHVKLQDHNHNREVVFALPSLRLHFKTEHVQGPTTPESTGSFDIFNSIDLGRLNRKINNFPLAEEKPVVECSFITECEDHIFVTVDADAFFFLHDLISSYIKEKDRVVRSTYFLHCVLPYTIELKLEIHFSSAAPKTYDLHHRIHPEVTIKHQPPIQRIRAPKISNRRK